MVQDRQDPTIHSANARSHDDTNGRSDVNRGRDGRGNELIVNGERQVISSDPLNSLLSVLREDLGLIGSKIGCGEGECGACTVLVDGRPVRSCVEPVGEVFGAQVLTIEGLERDGRLHPLQEAFLQVQAFQCGYCTPGMIMSALALLLENPEPSEETIYRRMQGHICRCGTYGRIVQAIMLAGVRLREEAPTGGVR